RPTSAYAARSRGRRRYVFNVVAISEHPDRHETGVAVEAPAQFATPSAAEPVSVLRRAALRAGSEHVEGVYRAAVRTGEVARVQPRPRAPEGNGLPDGEDEIDRAREDVEDGEPDPPKGRPAHAPSPESPA